MPLPDADLLALPKVELHVHLEGTIRADTAIALARRHGEDPADVLPLVDGGYPPRFTSFAQFVEVYLAVSALLREPEDLEVVARAFARQQADQGVRYSEATFTATTHVNNGMDPDAMWEAVVSGLSAVPTTRVGLIVDAVRNFGSANADQTIEVVAAAPAAAPIIALGLAGTETAAPAEDFTVLRPAADELGLGLVVHAGEIGPPSEVVKALDVLGADRIGHGIAAAADPEVLDRVVRDEVVLEVCPTSNVVLGAADSHDTHPLPALVAAGAQVTINSDDPPFFATTFLDELRHAERMLDLDRRGLAVLQRRAVRASYLEPADRDALVADIGAWLGDEGQWPRTSRGT